MRKGKDKETEGSINKGAGSDSCHPDIPGKQNVIFPHVRDAAPAQTRFNSFNLCNLERRKLRQS